MVVAVMFACGREQEPSGPLQEAKLSPASAIALPLKEVPLAHFPIRCIEELANLPEDKRPEEHLSAWCREKARLLTSDMAPAVISRYQACVDEIPIVEGDPGQLGIHVLCRRLAEGDDPDAEYEMGKSFDHGFGVPKSFHDAVKWYEKAATDGHTEAQVSLGLLYAGAGLHVGSPKNDRKACHWYKLAAENGDGGAASLLGSCFENGVGMPRNYQEAFRWYRFAAEGRDFYAPHKLAKLYAQGKGTPKDLVRAYAWNSILAADGNIAAQQFQDELEREMTADQVARAQQSAAELLERYGHPFDW